MRILRLFGVLVVVGCATAPEPELPIVGSAPMVSVPVEYSTYWAQIEACSGLRRPDHVVFFAFPGKWFSSDGFVSVAVYQYEARRITLTTVAENDPMVIRHEMLHAVLPPNYAAPEDDAAAHPVEYFGVPGSTSGAALGKCGAIVAH